MYEKKIQDIKKFEKAKQVVDNNFNGKKDTFIYFFHERSEFKKDFLLELIEAIRFYAEKNINNNFLNRELSRKINFIHIYILKNISSYLYDNFRQEFEDSIYLEHYKYLERLESAVDGFFQGYVIEESKFEPFDPDAKL
jgi:hypothetical protein